jgi:hypothetical protein
MAPGCVQEGICCEADRLCMSQVCNGVGYTCGVDENGEWAWLPDSLTVTCDDEDPCTDQDACVNGSCLGVPARCDTPPPSECVDSSTLRSYSAPGSCVAEQGCVYSYIDTACPQGCRSGQCMGEPCLGIQCTTPPGPCHQNPGTCVAGQCTYTQLPAGSSCDTGDPCETGGTCDDQGLCQGTGLSCSAANATGTCVNGACKYSCQAGFGNCNNKWDDGCEMPLNTTSNCGNCGVACSTGAHATASCDSGVCTYTCASGYGNCNGSWGDGCETSLTTSSNCGACGKTCSSMPNATATCQNGTCKVSCKSPYKNCDGKTSNGCEIPVGVANRCDKSGLNSNKGCGTAYCGSSSTANAANFGTWTCTFCSHCHHYSNGYSWCLYGSSSPGQFSPDRCTDCCNDSLTDKVCPK